MAWRCCASWFVVQWALLQTGMALATWPDSMAPHDGLPHGLILDPCSRRKLDKVPRQSLRWNRRGRTNSKDRVVPDTLAVLRLRGGKHGLMYLFGRKDTARNGTRGRSPVGIDDIAKDLEAGTLQWRDESALPVHHVKSSGLQASEDNMALSFTDNGILWRIPHPRKDESVFQDSEDEMPRTYLYAPYGTITSFDLQFERTLANRMPIPLVRLTVELQHPAQLIHIQTHAEHRVSHHQHNQLQLQQLRRPGRLVTSWVRFQDAGKLEESMSRTQQSQEQRGNDITMVLPGWVQLFHNVLPTAMYSPGLRRTTERLVVCWMSLSFLWALWQLYHHLELFAAAVRPFVRVMMIVFGRFLRRIDDVLDSWTAKYIHWMKPIDVVIYRIRSSGLLSSPLVRDLRSFFASLRLPAVQLPSFPHATQLVAKISAAWASLHVPLPSWLAQHWRQFASSVSHVWQPMASSAWSVYGSALKQLRQLLAPSIKAIASLVQRKDALNPVGLSRVARQNTILIVRAGTILKRRIGTTTGLVPKAASPSATRDPSPMAARNSTMPPRARSHSPGVSSGAWEHPVRSMERGWWFWSDDGSRRNDNGGRGRSLERVGPANPKQSRSMSLSLRNAPGPRSRTMPAASAERGAGVGGQGEGRGLNGTAGVGQEERSGERGGRLLWCLWPRPDSHLGEEHHVGSA